MESDQAIIDSDNAYLRQFGVEPRLKRALGFVTSSLFAIAFQGPTTGALLITGATLALGGPAFVWAIPVIFLFQLVVALNWAELTSHYPLTGGIYQWAKYLGGEGIGWLTGLFYLVAIILVMPAVGFAMNIVLSSFTTTIGINNETQIVISLFTIVATAIVISTSVRLVALINSAGVFLELIVLGGTAIFLLLHHHQSLSVFANTGGTDAHQSYIVPFLIVIALVVTQIVGFETAGAFAEETVNSRLRPGQAIIAGLAGTALFLFIFDGALILSIPNVAQAMASPDLIPATLKSLFGDTGEKIFLASAFVSVSSTSIATLAAITRTMYGMARDNQLPGARYLSWLSPQSDEPVVAVAVGALLSMIPLAFVSNIPVIVAAITAMILVPYLLVLGSLMRRRLAGWPTSPAPFRLGPWGIPLTAIGIVWVVGVIVDAAWKRDVTNPTLGPFPVIWEFGVVTLVVGLAWWFLYLKDRVPTEPVSPEPSREPAGISR
jgi:amino acid transporter